MGFASLANIIKIPEHHQVAVGNMIDGVKMQLKALVALWTIALQYEI